MAQTKEGTVVILDFTRGTRESRGRDKTFFEKQKDCCIKLLQNKIFAGKKDEIAFILMGTQNTDNELNRTLDGYENIVEGIPMQIPNWNMLTTLVKSLDLESGIEKIDWMDALIIALDIMRREEAKRFKYLKVILFHQFKQSSIDDSSTEEVIQRLKELNIEFIIINDQVKYKDDIENNKIISFFPESYDKHMDQQVSERVAQKIINETEGILCNFDIAIYRILRGGKAKGRPWFWYSTLDIGTKVKIHVAVTISIKQDDPLRFKTENVNENTMTWLATEYFQNGEKILSAPKGDIQGALTNADDPALINKQEEKQFLVEELINGYMLGSTPVPYEKQPIETKKGMQCIGFTARSNVLPQYLLGNGTYLVFAKATMETSEKMMAALVKAMEKNNLVMIGRRVYNDGNRPKFIALFPNTEQKYPCLSLFELYSAEQQVHWNFAPLRSKKHQPSKEQYDAVEDLMNAMDLDNVIENNDGIRDHYEKDLLPFDRLPNVTQEYIYQITTERIIEESKDITLSLQGRDNFFNVPEFVYKKSQEPIEKIKELFPLEEIKKEVKKELIRHCGDIDSREMNNDVLIDEKPLDYKSLISVGTVTPAEDFKLLIKREVEIINSENMNEKISTFDRLKKQIEEVLKDLIFKTVQIQYEKVVNGLKMYREEACLYNPFDYNDFIREIKAISLSRKMFEFWEKVIVENHLGLISAKESDLLKDDDVNDIEEFYNINVERSIENDAENEGNVDDLFDDM